MYNIIVGYDKNNNDFDISEEFRSIKSLIKKIFTNFSFGKIFKFEKS